MQFHDFILFNNAYSRFLSYMGLPVNRVTGKTFN